MKYKKVFIFGVMLINFSFIYSMENDKNILDLGVDNINVNKFEYFTKLPKDMQLEIIKYLGFMDIKNFRLSAKLLKNLISNEDFIKQRNLAIKLTLELINYISHGPIENANVILNSGNVQLNVQDEDGSTALIEASSTGKKEIVELLIALKVKLNLQNRYGQTALIEAIRNFREKIVKLLIDANANIALKDKDGMTALDIAKKKLEENPNSYSPSLNGEKGTFVGIVKLLEDAVNDSKEEIKEKD